MHGTCTCTYTYLRIQVVETSENKITLLDSLHSQPVSVAEKLNDDHVIVCYNHRRNKVILLLALLFLSMYESVSLVLMSHA